MRFPYMRTDTKISLIVGLACAAVIGLSGFGLFYDITHMGIDNGTFVIILVLSILGLGFGFLFEYIGWSCFIEEYDYDKQHERYRTVKTY